MGKRYIEDIVEELTARAFENSVRLFRDACTLYCAGAYPTAFAIAVLSYEELGKMHSMSRLGDCCDEVGIDDPSGKQASEFFVDVLAYGGLTNHRHKQVSALFATNLMATVNDRPKVQFITEGGLESAKQQALYVELTDEYEVLTPSRISQDKAFGMLQDVLAALKESRDVAYMRADDWESTPRSQWQAAEQLRIATAAFDRCTAYQAARPPKRRAG
jgi:AbiV family abortive infection protein